MLFELSLIFCISLFVPILVRIDSSNIKLSYTDINLNEIGSIVGVNGNNVIFKTQQEGEYAVVIRKIATNIISKPKLYNCC